MRLIINKDVGATPRKERPEKMCISEMKRGEMATIVEVPEGILRHQLLRFGIAPGTSISCRCRIPFGPVVVGLAGQEIALGRDIARSVMVR